MKLKDRFVSIQHRVNKASSTRRIRHFSLLIFLILLNFKNWFEYAVIPDDERAIATLKRRFPWLVEKNAPFLKAHNPPALDDEAAAASVKKEYKWAIVATVNSGFLDFFLNWMTHFDRLGPQLDNVLVYIVAEDADVVPKLESIPRIQVVTTNLNLTDAHAVGSKGHTKLVSQRPGQILQVWELTTKTNKADALLFIDLDTVWLGNPFPDIEESLMGGYYDMATQVNMDERLNTGLVAIPKTDRNYQFLELWRNKIEDSVRRSQPAYNTLVREHDRKVAILPVLTFPTGLLFFESRLYQQWAKIVHTNGPGKGHDVKKKKLKRTGLWNIEPNYKELLS